MTSMITEITSSVLRTIYLVFYPCLTLRIFDSIETFDLFTNI